jgi:hypothetical protein
LLNSRRVTNKNGINPDRERRKDTEFLESEMKNLHSWIFFIFVAIIAINNHVMADESDRCYDRAYRLHRCLTLVIAFPGQYKCDPEDNIRPSEFCMRTKAYEQGRDDGIHAAMNIAEAEVTKRRSEFREGTYAENPNKDKGSVSPKTKEDQLFENQLFADIKKAIQAVDANESVQTQIRAQAKKPSILTTKSDVYVSTDLDCMKVILISVQQNNLAGLREAISVGLQEGVLDMLGESEQVELVEDVNGEIFKLRPVGSDNVYYSIRIFFSPEEPK